MPKDTSMSGLYTQPGTITVERVEVQKLQSFISNAGERLTAKMRISRDCRQYLLEGLKYAQPQNGCIVKSFHLMQPLNDREISEHMLPRYVFDDVGQLINLIKILVERGWEPDTHLIRSLDGNKPLPNLFHVGTGEAWRTLALWFKTVPAGRYQREVLCARLLHPARHRFPTGSKVFALR